MDSRLSPTSRINILLTFLHCYFGSDSCCDYAAARLDLYGQELECAWWAPSLGYYGLSPEDFLRLANDYCPLLGPVSPKSR